MCVGGGTCVGVAARNRVARHSLPQTPGKTRFESANLYGNQEPDHTEYVEGASRVCLDGGGGLFLLWRHVRPEGRRSLGLLPASCEGRWLRSGVPRALSVIPNAAAATKPWGSVRDSTVLMQGPRTRRGI